MHGPLPVSIPDSIRDTAVNFMGMGVMEMAVILLVAFLVLGPGKSIDMARTAGRLVRDLRRSFAEIAAAVDIENLDQPASPRKDQDAPDDPPEQGSQ